jgi:tryptophanyl-tRNA synthetase
MVPVGEDQVRTLSRARLARRFNHIYGTEPGFEEKRCGGENGREAALNTPSTERHSERGDAEALEAARAMLNDTQKTCRLANASGLRGLPRRLAACDPPEPAPLLTETPKVPGLDGQKMSKLTATRS